MSNEDKPSVIKDLEIIVHSYQDMADQANRPYLGGSSYVVIGDDQQLDTKRVTYEENYTFVYELQLIFKGILAFYSRYVGTEPIRIYCSERAMVKMLNNGLNRTQNHLKSSDGQFEYRDQGLNDFIDHMMTEELVFDPRIKSIEYVRNFLEKWVPLINAHVLSLVKFECIYYAAKTKHKADPDYRYLWEIANEIRNHVLRKNDIAMGFDLSATESDVLKRRAKWSLPK